MVAEITSLGDKEVVKLALKERALFGHIVERYQGKLSRYVTRLGVRDPDDRDDVLQEVFIKVYRNLNDYDDSYSFSAWIYRIAHNEAISWYRKKKVRPEGNLVADSEEVLAFLNNDEEDASVRLDQKINAEYLQKAMAELDPKYRDIIILRYFEHLEYEEISDVLKLPLGTVGTFIHRAKKQLREFLTKYE